MPVLCTVHKLIIILEGFVSGSGGAKLELIEICMEAI